MNENSNKKEKTIKVHITGYGLFEGIDINPTELLVNKIFANLKDINKTLGSGLEIVHAEVLKVSIEEVNQRTQLINEKINSSFLENPNEIHFIIHLGVDCGAEEIHLESRCVNMCTGEDVDGNCIDGKIKRSGTNDYYDCKLDLDKICNELNKKHKVDISNDAGDYLCNYVYYLSSTKWHNVDNVYPLFIHSPSLETISSDMLYDCIMDFFRCIKKIYL